MMFEQNQRREKKEMISLKSLRPSQQDLGEPEELLRGCVVFAAETLRAVQEDLDVVQQSALSAADAGRCHDDNSLLFQSRPFKNACSLSALYL